MKIKFILNATESNPFCSLKDMSASEIDKSEVKGRHYGVSKCKFNIDYC